MVDLDRRSAVIRGCSGIISLGMIGVASADTAEDELDENFDPDDGSEVRRFVENFDELDDHDHQSDIINDLNGDQQTAVFEARKPTEMVVKSVGSVDDDAIGIQSNTDSNTHEHTVELQQAGTGTTYYEFHHRISWEYDQEEVSNYDSEGWVTNVAFGYGDGGSNESWIDSNITDGDARSFESFRQREIFYGIDIPYVDVISYYPSTQLLGNYYGYVTTIDEDDGL